MKKAELIFVPAPFLGHIVSIVGLAKILAEQYEQQLRVTVLILKLPYDEKVVSYSKQLVADSSSSGIRFVELITPEQPSSSASGVVGYLNLLMHTRIRLDIFLLRHLMKLLQSSWTCSAPPLLMWLMNLKFQAVFSSSGAAVLGLTLHLQRLRDEFNEDVASYLDKDINLSVPTYINHVPAKLSPGLVFDKEHGGSNAFLDQAKRYRLAKGIIVNTFLELESHAVQALSEDETIPPVYTAGPIVVNHIKGSSSSEQNQENDLKIMKWLDLQPNSSVVFLCFGSLGNFSKEQVVEIAYALERSGYRFLWSLRKPPAEEAEQLSSGPLFPSEYGTVHEVLPEGFLNRTINIGKVIGWAPQMQVLSHPAVGGFISHCGWNSTLESVWCGVPMAAFPIYAEQQANAFLLVKELGLGVEIKIDHMKHYWCKEDDIVKAEVIENGIRQLMNQENEIMRRSKVMEMKEKCRVALKKGGSSSTSIRCFIDDIINYKK